MADLSRKSIKRERIQKLDEDLKVKQVNIGLLNAIVKKLENINDFH